MESSFASGCYFHYELDWNLDEYFPELEKHISHCSRKTGPQLPVQVKLRRGAGTGWGTASQGETISQGL